MLLTLSGIQVGRGWEGGKDFLPAVCRGFVLLWRWHRVISWMVCCQKPSPPSVRGEMTEPEGNISLLVSHTARGKQVLLPHRAPLGSRISHGVKNEPPRNPTRRTPLIPGEPHRPISVAQHRALHSSDTAPHLPQFRSTEVGVSAPHRAGADEHTQASRRGFFLPLPPTLPKHLARKIAGRSGAPPQPRGCARPTQEPLWCRAWGGSSLHPPQQHNRLRRFARKTPLNEKRKNFFPLLSFFLSFFPGRE